MTGTPHNGIEADHLAAILDSVSDACFAVDHSGRFLYANWKAELLLERSRGNLVGHSAAEVLTPAVAAVLLPALRRALDTRSSVHFEWFYAAFTAWLEASAYPTRDGVAFYLRDISERRGAEQALRDSEARFRTMFEHAAIGIALLDGDGMVVTTNAALQRMTALPPAALHGVPFRELLRFDTTSDQRGWDELLRGARPRWEANGRLLRDDARLVWTRITASAIRSERDGADLVVAIVEDITLARRAVDALRESERFLHTTLDALAARVAILDEDGLIIATNLAWRASEDDDFLHGPMFAIGCNYLELCAAAQQSGRSEAYAAADGIRDVLAGTRDHFYLEYRSADAPAPAWYSLRITPFGGDWPPHAVVAHEDITQRKLVEEQLLHSALHDTLTGLPNRALFLDRLQHLLRRSQRRNEFSFAVLFVDLDRFKLVNDSLGHVAGDELLVGTARRLESCLRPGDTIARLGGDEFVILLDEVGDISDATRIAERIHRELEEPFRVAGQEVFTSASIGITLSATGYSTPGDVLRDADTAMYRAKAQGRARHEVFDREMHAQALAQLRIENDLRRALERRELRVFYQPIVELESQRITGFEALLRWQHPQLGLVPPARFIAVAEDTGLILPIGEWVLREACRQMAEWTRSLEPDAPLTVNVNISGRQFQRGELLDLIRDVLADAQLPGNRLKLEITESVLLQNPRATAEMIAELREMGIAVCIDDFGTGYSSLSYLHRLAVDALKIDRSFVQELDGDGLELVRTILALAEGLGVEAIAEGVETPTQVARLRQLGSRFGQGYLFSEPVDAELATGLLYA